MTTFQFITGELWTLLWYGLPATLGLSVLSIAIGTLVGLFVALGKQSRNGFLRRLSGFYSWLFRSLPALLTLFYVYYALPQVGIRFDSFTAAVIGLSLVAGAYLAEVLRSGLAAVPRGQYEASKSLGMSASRTIRRIILPQVARVVVGPYFSQCTMIVKSSALASLISVEELTGIAYARLSYTFRPLEILLLVWIIYLAINSLLVSTQLVAERRFGRNRARASLSA